MINYNKRHYHYFIKSFNTKLTNPTPVKMSTKPTYKAPTMCFDVMEMVGREVELLRIKYEHQKKMKPVLEELTSIDYEQYGYPSSHLEWGMGEIKGYEGGRKLFDECEDIECAHQEHPNTYIELEQCSYTGHMIPTFMIELVKAQQVKENNWENQFFEQFGVTIYDHYRQCEQIRKVIGRYTPLPSVVALYCREIK
tara:strand:+ start:151 stop:738 length:588 start_codon:yes stop_codon:yes gene_type:complete